MRPDDPVARALTWATISSSLSRAVFFSVSVLFFTRVAGFTATTVGVALTVAGAVAVGAALGAGYLARLVGARSVLMATAAGQGVALGGYLVVRTPVAFVVVACVAVSLSSMQRTALATTIAESFTGSERIEVRARLRAVTNAFIGVGTGLAAVALAVGTRPAYLTAMAATGVLQVVSVVPLRRVPRAVVAPSSGPARQVRRSPLRDRTYLVATGLYAVTTMQFGMLTVGVPLWISGWTNAPAVTVAVLLTLDAAIVSLLQVWAARGAKTIRAAGRATARGGVLLAVACGLYAAATERSVVVAVTVLTLATIAHSLAEIQSEAGRWTLAFELADPTNAGAYQGVSQMGMAVGTMLAPLVVTATAIEHGRAGWAALAALFLAAGLSTLWLAKRHSARKTPA
ncbi:MFS transporter [Micromonospora sp. STR1_7]|uniref:MFS transporter n=1 Tax=Micromonospora parastrephiae TaxID=2806101 RepID=A0ABS1XT19_9ACTN|nr:MFS transporter [Micromonospora parastrephiae]